MNYDTTDHPLWNLEPEESSERDYFDEADLMYSEYKLEKLKEDD
jgi:hypothetical protein